MPKVSTMQRKARSWQSSLAKLNEARPGQLAIAYSDEQGGKRIGYVDLFDISVELGDTTLSFGELVESMIERENTLIADLTTLQGQNKTLEENILKVVNVIQVLNLEIETLKADLGAVKKDIYPDTAHL